MNRYKINLIIYLFMLNFLINGCASIIYKSIPLKDVAKTSGKYFVAVSYTHLTLPTKRIV